jgi:ATP adenylyltransferase/5',5'''-P-1,P-4-tetraphosphate phosphorylase II
MLLETFSATSFLKSQLSTWSLAATNYAALNQVQRRTLTCEGVQIHLQFNPHRILSSTAKVDSASIQSRPCFLCDKHLPQEQHRQALGDGFQLLVNPYPIFPEHFTIPTLTHQPQRIATAFGSMLDVAHQMQHTTIFYNGPRCGASAPDHLHFQAGNRGFLPIEADFLSKQWCKAIITHHNITFWKWDNYLRSVITIEGNDHQSLATAFQCVYRAMEKWHPNEAEPMLNVLAYWDHNHWTIHIFPRANHRPWQFAATGDDQILISPASVDFGGVWILPREVDFNKLNANHLIDIFKQTSTDSAICDAIQTRAIDDFITGSHHHFDL